MRSLDRLRLRLRSLLLRGRVEAELHAELSFHLEQQIEEYVAAGMAPAEARHAALRSLGPLSRIEEECRDMRRTRWLETLLQDLGYGVRALRLSPAFTLVAALSLALGIGANTAIFSLMDALLLRSLPVREPERLVTLGNPARTGGHAEGSVRSDLFSLPMYRELRDKNQVFSDVFASGRTGLLIVGGDRSATTPETVQGRFVTGNYFSVLGVPAFRGRTFTADDDRPGAAPFVVISHDYWRRRFSADPGAIGRTILLNGYPFTIVGVTPPEFFGEVVGTSTDLWIPAMMQPQANPGRNYLDGWGVNWLLLMGRLKPGVSIEQARGSMEALFSRIVANRAGGAIAADLLPDDLTKLRLEVTPGGAGFSHLRSRFSRPLSTLMAIVALVLLIACANVANLLLERATGRRKEISVRLALGAGRGRLVRQLLTESLLLAGLGGALGVLFAFWADAALLGLIGVSRSGALDLRPNLHVLAFTAAVALLTGILFGLAPAVRATRVELAPALKESSRNVAGPVRRRWPLGKVLVVAQFAISLLLLIGAGLFVRTLVNLQRLDLGFPREGLVMMELDPVAAGYPEESLKGLLSQLLERLKAVPGVSGVTLSENGIFSGTDSGTSIVIPGRPALSDADDDVSYDRVGPDYFKVVGIPILQGRGIGPRDRAGALRVAVINEAMARFYFPGQSPLGQRFAESNAPDILYEIVGVSRDVRDHDLRGPVERRYYAPMLQAVESLSAFNFEIRAPEPRGVLKPIREAVRSFDPRLTVLDLAPLDANIDASIGDEHLVAKLSVVFGALALLLASIGLYGVISYTIARRTNEIGIRMALGASEGRVLWMVLRETLLLALAGIVLGLLAVLASARVLSSRLFGLSAYDPLTITAATAVLVTVAVIAGFIPGSRATRVDPTEALR